MKLKKYTIFTILLIFLLNKKINYSQKCSFKYFKDILPKITYQNKNIQTLDEIFNSKRLYISDANLSQKYIKYIRRINKKEEKKYKKRFSKSETIINSKFFIKRMDQYNFKDFLNLCARNELLINTSTIKYNNKPLISIILPSFNKQDTLMISVRSIQNQSFKNIEIIIVDDCSSDNSNEHFKYLLETDPRIRIFTHIKNMGVWRSRLDGFLYSRGKYILYFDTGDLYEDNYVLEDLYRLMEKYNLDSAKMLFRLIYHYNSSVPNKVKFHVYNNSKIVYGYKNIMKMNKLIFRWGNIWNRITRANIYTKGIYLLNDRVLNIYKNLWEDKWHNELQKIF